MASVAEHDAWVKRHDLLRDAWFDASEALAALEADPESARHRDIHDARRRYAEIDASYADHVRHGIPSASPIQHDADIATDRGFCMSVANSNA
jgi:hypothetical protein